MQRNRGKQQNGKKKLEISSRKLEIPREHFKQRGTKNDRNGMDLTEVEDFMKTWKQYTEELPK